jgi:L,D-peptidoglycan transpeptidase YkuD (ErfK/YbiS/YcfS/YnhG family)
MRIRVILLLAVSACSRAVPVTVPVAVPAPVSPLASAQQLVVVTTPNWNATTGTLRQFERDDARAPWRPVAAAIPVVIGRTGLAWGDETLASSVGQPIKHEGDGRSPAGLFPLDTAFGFAPRSELSWLRLPYAALQPGSDCVDDEASAYYNTVVDRAVVPKVDWNSAEHMRQIPVYRLGVIVGYNATPPKKGRGSCIFLHIWGGPSSTTAGCTALDAGALESLMRWLDRARRPALVQLPADEYARLMAAWGLPPA